MKIILENISKQFNRQWIFKNVNLAFTSGNTYAITGQNGSGKSTFIQIVSGFSLPSSGRVVFRAEETDIQEENQFKYVSIAAPYLELVEEFTLEEILDFHFKFVPMINNESKSSLLEYIWLDNAKNKPVKFFSSGMKQRLKLGLALFTDKPIIIFDEPTVNLDEQGCKWYHKSIAEKINDRMLIIASNVAEEYSSTNNLIKISDYNG